MVVFKRFPKWKLAYEEKPLIPLAIRSNYPSFAADFVALDKELMQFYYALDKKALIQQNKYRRLYVALILGSSLVTVLGVLQIAFLSFDVLGALGAITAAVLSITTALVRNRHYHKSYLNTRLAAERLRSEYFLFLGHYAPYENEQDRIEKLRQTVSDIVGKGNQ